MAGVPIINPEERARQASAARDEFANNPGILRKLAMGLLQLPHDVAFGGKRELAPGENLAYALQMVSPQALAPVEGGLGIFGGRIGARRLGREFTSVGKDEKPRFEIDDSVSLMTAPRDYLNEVPHTITTTLPGGQEIPWTRSVHPSPRLTDVLDHPELYAAYPDLKNIRLRKSGHGGGSYDDTFQIINLPGRGVSDKSILLHELSHAVARREGHDPGSNPRVYSDANEMMTVDRAEEASRLIDQKLSALRQRGASFGDPEVKRLVDAQARLAEFKRLKREQANPFNKYMRNAGETEARNVQTRMDWNAQRRSEVPPEVSEDVPRSRQTLGDLLKAMGNRS